MEDEKKETSAFYSRSLLPPLQGGGLQPEYAYLIELVKNERKKSSCFYNLFLDARLRAS